MRAIGICVVGHHRLGGSRPELAEVLERPPHERRRGLGALVGVLLDVGVAGVIVDAARAGRRARLVRRSRRVSSAPRVPGVRAGESAPAGRCRREAGLLGATTHSGGRSAGARAAGAIARGDESTFQIVERARRQIPARRPGPRPVSRRARRIGSSSAALRRLGWRWGREERSRSQAAAAALGSLAARQRCHQRCAVAGATLRAAAAALNVMPRLDHANSARRPAGPRVALA